MSDACVELAKRLMDSFTPTDIQRVAEGYGIAHASMTVNQLIEALEEFGSDGFAEVLASAIEAGVGVEPGLQPK